MFFAKSEISEEKYLEKLSYDMTKISSRDEYLDFQLA